MMRRPLGPLLAVLVAGALGCSTATSSGSSASAAPGSDYPGQSVPPASAGRAGDADAASDPALRARGPRDRPPVPSAPDLAGAYRFVSAPDFLNQDVADLTAGGRREHVVAATGEVANSTNEAYETALGRVIDEMADQGADDVLVAGDLVEGRWGRDDSRTGVFGPVRTDAQRLRAWRRAADVYYPAWFERFADRGLATYPAVGDHEIGDDPWRARRGDPWVDFKRRHLPEFKRIFAQHALSGSDGLPRFADRPPRGPARHTAYAVRLDRDVLLVSLDVFERRGGDVHVSVDPAQLRWLAGVLRRAERDDVPWVMVQAHTPMPGAVRVRNSTHLVYEKGRSSDLWRTMVDGGVDVYLSGEVHDQTVRQRDGVLEVSHGSLFYRGEASYVVGQATAERLVLENRQFRGTVGFDSRLWTTSRQGAPAQISYPPRSIVTGTLVASRTRAGGVRVDDAEGVLVPRG
ncbi:metallophosphoesterase [Nocardioides sp. zg-1228]|uniref:metallophosphoesterase family protein n=1 Tax=Nocardioides sp. zg-1228 TaxID=2763008 RepID=UPI0016432B68|nr:metallophosphoesterase [Nocardioides sp. zg-1228]MBC2933502.1 metallophosphoesterase [Nocardioides sp. zg-1228]QSF56362.1 metallophosphoesterase [Nocardioides sp. zg-1228]